MHFRAGTYSDEGLVEAVEAKVPDEPPADERGNKPEVEVGDHQERSAAHHPKEHGHMSGENTHTKQIKTWSIMFTPWFRANSWQPS